MRISPQIMINCKSFVLTLILPASILYGCGCSEETTQNKSCENDSIDTIALDNDTILPFDSVAIDTITIDTTAIDSISTVNDEQQYFDPSTVVDNTKKNLKQHLISLNQLIDKANSDLANDSISQEEASKIGERIISFIDSISKEPKATEFKNQIKTVTRRANRLMHNQ